MNEYATAAIALSPSVVMIQVLVILHNLEPDDEAIQRRVGERGVTYIVRLVVTANWRAFGSIFAFVASIVRFLFKPKASDTNE